MSDARHGYGTGGDDTQQTDDEYESALGEALGEEPRAQELRQMEALLRARRAALIDELDTAEEASRPKLRHAIADLDEKVAVLNEEASITKFVEDAVRVGIEMRRLESS